MCNALGILDTSDVSRTFSPESVHILRNVEAVQGVLKDDPKISVVRFVEHVIVLLKLYRHSPPCFNTFNIAGFLKHMLQKDV